MITRLTALCCGILLTLSACGGDGEKDATQDAAKGEPKQSETASPTPEPVEVTPFTAAEYEAEMTAIGAGYPYLSGFDGMAQMLCQSPTPDIWLYQSLSMRTADYTPTMEALGMRRYCLDKADIYYEASALHAELEADPSAYCAREDGNYGLRNVYCLALPVT